MGWRNWIGVALAVPCALGAQATERHGLDLSVGLRIGTLGLGGEVAKLITSHVAVRGSVNYYSATVTKTQSNIQFRAHGKLHAASAVADFFLSPRGSFHVSGGVMTNPVTIDGTGVATNGTFVINGTHYSSDQVGTLTGHGEYGSALPYVGLGWGTPAASHTGLKFVFDLGAAIGKPTVTLHSTSSSSQVQSDVAAQQVKTQSDVNRYAKVYPVLSLGLVARF